MKFNLIIIAFSMLSFFSKIPLNLNDRLEPLKKPGLSKAIKPKNQFYKKKPGKKSETYGFSAEYLLHSFLSNRHEPQDPTFWPFIASSGALMVPIGGIFYLDHETLAGLALMLNGLCTNLYAVLGCCRDIVIVKAIYANRHSVRAKKTNSFGLTIFTISMVAFLFWFFWDFFRPVILTIFHACLFVTIFLFGFFWDFFLIVTVGTFYLCDVLLSAVIKTIILCVTKAIPYVNTIVLQCMQFYSYFSDTVLSLLELGPFQSSLFAGLPVFLPVVLAVTILCILALYKYKSKKTPPRK